MISLAFGGFAGFTKIFVGLLGLGIVAGIIFLSVLLVRRRSKSARPPSMERPDASTPMQSFTWTEAKVAERLYKIDSVPRPAAG